MSLLVWLVGCQRPETGATAGAAETEGHVYLAQLITLHPMYADLVRMAEAERSLRAPERMRELPELALGGHFGGEWAGGPVELVWPYEAQVARQDLVRTGAESRDAPDTGELPPDVAARLHARITQAQRSEAVALLRARSETGDALAGETAALYRKNLERLSGGVAGEKAEDVRAELEAEVAELQKRQGERLAEVVEAEAAKRDDRVRAATEEAERVARGRMAAPLGGGTRLREQMLEALGSFEVPAWVTTVQVDMPEVTLPDPATSGPGLEAARRAAREAAGTALAARQVRVTDELLHAARLAAEKVGRGRGLRLRFVPGDEPLGADLTDEIAPAVRELWHAGS